MVPIFLWLSTIQKRNLGNEIIHTEKQNIKLKSNDPLLFFIQRLRDEAHRFAITSHRSNRLKMATKSVFDELTGIGPKRKKLLMLHFGSINKIEMATLEELKKVKNLPTSAINAVYDFLRR